MKNKYFILALTFLCLLMGQSSFGQLDGGDRFELPSEFGYRPPVTCAGCGLEASDVTTTPNPTIGDIDVNIPNTADSSDTSNSSVLESSNTASSGFSSWGGGSAGISTGGSGGDVNNDSSNDIASTDNSGYPSDGGFGALPVTNYTGSNSYTTTENNNQSPTNSTDDPLYFGQDPNPNIDLYGITDAVAESIAYSERVSLNGVSLDITQYGKIVDGTVYIKTADGSYKLPSQLDPKSNADRTALDRFAASLACGLDGLNKDIGITCSPGTKSSSKSQASTRGTIITLNSNGGFSKDLDDINNFKSIIKHEIFHVDDNKIPNFKSNLSTHADVYIKAATKDDNFKNTTIEFQKGNAGSFANYLLNMDKRPEFSQNEILAKITEYNKNKGRVKILGPQMNFSKGTLNLRVQVDNVPSDYITYEPINE